MQVASLDELYSGITDRPSSVYVVPLIRYDYKETDYLYLLYKELIESAGDPEIISTSIANHYKFVFAALFRRNVILHYHWLEFQDLKALFGMPYKLLCIWLYTLLGGKMVWTVHNLKPHDKKYLSFHRRLHQWMARKADVIHVHSQTALYAVKEYYQISEDKIRVLFHPEFPARSIPKDEAISKVQELYGYPDHSIDSPVFLVFGGISEYKGLRTLITIMKEFSEDFTFIIAGYVKRGHEPLHRYIVQQIIDDHRFIYTNNYIPDEHFPYLLSAADICPFNYDDILTSGGVEMARSYGKTIIAPRKGGLKELQSHDNIDLFDSVEELTQLLHSSVQTDG